MYKLSNLSKLIRILQNSSKYRTVLEHLLCEEWDLMDNICHIFILNSLTVSTRDLKVLVLINSRVERAAHCSGDKKLQFVVGHQHVT